MTIPRRTDHSNGEIKGMKLLAELPHVGVAPIAAQRPAVATEEAPARKAKSNHPAFAEVIEFEDEPVPTRQHGETFRYVDQAHRDDPWDEQDELEHLQRDRTRGRRVPQRQPVGERHSQNRHRRASGMGRLLSDTHEQLAPFAGLIVTAALIACAGLLLLMMTGSKQDGADLDEYALPGFSVEAEGELTPANAPLADSAFTPETCEPEGLEHEPPQVPQQESAPATSAPADTSAATPQPVIEEITEPTVPLGEISFPVTSTPLALDLSKAFAPTADGLKELPEVAERESPTAPDPINR